LLPVRVVGVVGLPEVGDSESVAALVTVNWAEASTVVEPWLTTNT